MGKKSLESLTESMFYVLMSLWRQDLCGTEIADFVEQRTSGRLRLGPGTLYAILSKFEEEALITETKVEGLKRTYRITEAAREHYREETERLLRCLADAKSEGTI